MEHLPGRRRDERPGGDPEPELGPELEQGAEQVQDVLRRPEITALMEEFDHRVDAYLGIAS